MGTTIVIRASMHMFLLYMYLPAFLANGTPVIVRWLPLLRAWNAPISVPLFGAHKTWRGFVTGICVGAITGMLMHPFAGVVFGTLLGTGALLGDLCKSFVKRRIGIPPGAPWFPWDGIDYTAGALILGAVIRVPSIADVIILLIAGPVLSTLANLLSYFLGLKETWH